MSPIARGWLLFLLLVSSSASPIPAQSGSGGSASPARVTEPGDKSKHEEELIERRREWFWSSRRQGVASSEEARQLRWQAVLATRRAIALNRRSAAEPRQGEDAFSLTNVWTSRGPSASHFGGWAFGDISGRVPSLATDASGSTVYAGTASGGVWKSADGGATWTSIFDQAGTLTVGAVTVDPNNASTIWVGTGENTTGCESYFGIGLLRSADGGATWETRNGSGASTLEDLSAFASVVVDPRDSNRLVTGGSIRGCSSGGSVNGGIYTSDDAGLTWTSRLSDTPVYEIQQHPTEHDTYWAGTARGVYKSTDNGITWILQTASGLPNGSTGRTEIAVAPSDGGVVYTLFDSGGGGPALWRTTNGGTTWESRSTGSSACDGQCWYNMVIRVHRTDPDTLIRGTIHVFRSTDGGLTWTDLSGPWGSSQEVHQDTHEILMDPNDVNAFWVGCDGGVWKSNDLGQTFVNRNGNLNLTQFYAVDSHPTDPGILCGGAQDNSSLARGGGSGDVWDLQVATGDGFICQFNPQNMNYAYATSYPSIFPNVYRSTTGLFGSYSVITGFGSGIHAFDRTDWVTPYLVDPSTPNRLFLGTHHVYRSTNNGSNWIGVGPFDMTSGTGDIRALEINRGFNNVLYSGTTDSRIWRSTDSGSTWTNISTGLPPRVVSDVAGDPEDQSRALAAVAGFGTAHVWEWTASRGSWVGVGAGLPNVPANTVLMLSTSDVLVGADTGVFRSTDGGLTFTPYMQGLPEGTVVTDLKYNATTGLVTAGTYGRGAWQVTVGTPGSPGTVGVTATFDRLGNGDIEATWPDACNSASVPGQTYSIQAGDLDALQQSGTYAHAPIAGACNVTSPSTFTPGAGNEYYLVVPNFGGSEGGAGQASSGLDRPQTSTVCGLRQVAACP